MVKFYISLINREEITVDEVPNLWNAKVKQELGI